MALLRELGFLPLNARDDFNVLYRFFSRQEFTEDCAANGPRHRRPGLSGGGVPGQAEGRLRPLRGLPGRVPL